jgi:hypothetical protein
VLWKPACFGVKPEIIIKGGFIAGAMMGDGSASIPAPQPVIARDMFGGYGAALHTCSVHFVSQAGVDMGSLAGLARPVVAVRGCRTLGKRDLVLNSALPKIDVDPNDELAHGRYHPHIRESTRPVRAEHRWSRPSRSHKKRGEASLPRRSRRYCTNGGVGWSVALQFADATTTLTAAPAAGDRVEAAFFRRAEVVTARSTRKVSSTASGLR